MNTAEAQGLIDKLNSAKQKKAKLEGMIESIEVQWEEKYGFKTVEEAKEHVETLDARIKKLEKKEEILVTELDEIVDWDTV